MTVTDTTIRVLDPGDEQHIKGMVTDALKRDGVRSLRVEHDVVETPGTNGGIEYTHGIKTGRYTITLEMVERT